MFYYAKMSDNSKCQDICISLSDWSDLILWVNGDEIAAMFVILRLGVANTGNTKWRCI